jgi:hypothetical protein
MVLTFPVFLWGLFALSIPIIIHLFNFRKYKTLYFSNTNFVDHVKQDTKTKNKLKQYLILLTRLLLLTALVLAFARPVIPVDDSNEIREADAVAIYIDNSFSMESESEMGTLLNQALNKAYMIVDAFPDDVRYFLITNDFLPEHQRSYNKTDIKQLIASVDISPNSKKLNDIISKSLALKTSNSEMDLFIISDFQTNFVNQVELEPTGLNVNIVPLSINKQNNVFIDSCWFNEPVRLLNHSDELYVKIKNISDESYVDIPLNLFINDTLKAINSLNIDAKSDKTIKLAYTNTSKGINRGLLSITDYPVTFDNDIYFSYNIAEEIKVLIINGMLENRYLLTLLDTDDNYITIDQVRAGQERLDEFAGYNLIVLNDLSQINTGLLSELEAYLDRGNSVLVIPSAEADEQVLNEVLALFGMGTAGANKQSNTKIEKIDYNHVLFREVFAEIEENPDLPVISKAFPINLSSKSEAACVFGDGLGNCLFAAKNYNGGKIYFSAFPLIENIDFMKHPIFVAVFYNIVLQSQPVSDLYYISGNNSFVEIHRSEEVNSSNEVIHIVDSAGLDLIPLYRHVQGITKVFIPNNLRDKGHYNIVSEGKLLGLFSLNYDRSESILEYFINDDLSEELIKFGLDNYFLLDSKDKDMAQVMQEKKHGKEMWKYFIYLALFFIVAEVLIIRLMK